MTLLVIGGMDPTGGAGVLRDWWTARSLDPRREVAVVVTALTRQGRGPARAFPIEPGRLQSALDRVSAPQAVKIGMVPEPAVALLERFVAGLKVPVVIDPVLEATAGGRLGAPIDRLRGLLRRAGLVTPNRAEAQALVGDGSPDVSLGRRVAATLDGPAVLLKNAETSDRAVVRDELWIDGRVTVFEHPRTDVDPRGTGCALATAVAVGLAQRRALPDAIAEAIAWLDAARRETIPGPDGARHLPIP